MKFPSITATRLEYVLLPSHHCSTPVFIPLLLLSLSYELPTRRGQTKGKERIREERRGKKRKGMERNGKERKGYNERRGRNVQTVRTILTLANRFRSRAISLLIEAENEEYSRAVSFPTSRVRVPVLDSRRDFCDVLEK